MAPDKSIILFDGVCNLCRGSVQFVIRHDPKEKFQFASLQSDMAQALIKQHSGEVSSVLDTIILIEGGAAYYRSDAALRIAKSLHFPWSILSIFLIIPKKIRDLVYDFIGQRRYKWFGKMEACWLPDEKLARRFLDS